MTCSFCLKKILPGTFGDIESLKEMLLTGMCQQCQDEVFNGRDFLSEAYGIAEGELDMTIELGHLQAVIDESAEIEKKVTELISEMEGGRG